MSIRLDPRRVNALKHLAGEAGLRPGDLVRQWVEERIDSERGGGTASPILQRLESLEARIAAVEASRGEANETPAAAAHAREPEPSSERAGARVEPAKAAPSAAAEPAAAERTARRRRASAAPSGRVALHDEMIAVLGERGPMAAGELAAAIVERGRYAPPRSGKPLDAAMVSQRASNPTYRGRFRRAEGRIGLAE